jgi:hypothetical protein
MLVDIILRLIQAQLLQVLEVRRGVSRALREAPIACIS